MEKTSYFKVSVERFEDAKEKEKERVGEEEREDFRAVKYGQDKRVS